MTSSGKIWIILVITLLSDIDVAGKNPPNIKIDHSALIDSIQTLLNDANSAMDAGNFYEALSLAKRIHVLRLNGYSKSDPKIVQSYINLTYIYTMITDYDSAEYYLNKAEELYNDEIVRRGPELIDLYSNMGLVNSYLGDNLKAERCYLMAIDYFYKYSENSAKEDLILLYIRLANIQIKLKKFDVSLKYFNKCLDLIAKIKDQTRYKISCYVGMATVYSELKNFDQSIRLQIKAIEDARTDSTKHVFRLAILYGNIGNNYLKTNNIKSAESYLKAAIELFEKVKYKGSNIAQTLESLGRLYEKEGKRMLALKTYQQSLTYLSHGFNSPNLLTDPSINQVLPSPILITVLKSKINCLHSLYWKECDLKYLDAAINSSMLAIGAIEIMRNSYQDYESKLMVANESNSIYKNIQGLLQLAYRKTGDIKYAKSAFMISEKSKSAILLSSLQEMDARKFAGIPPELIDEEEHLSRTISLYKLKIFEENQDTLPDSKKIRNWEDFLFEAQQKHSRLIKNFETNYPKYYALKYVKSASDAEEIGKQLPRKTYIIDYALSDSSLAIFLIGRKTFTVKSVPIDSSFHKLLSNYISAFHNFDFSRQSYSDYTQFCWSSHKLYSYLIQPVEGYIHGENLVIIPDGALSYIPFETLISNLPEDIPSTYYKALNYMLYDYSISYAYSSSVYLQEIKFSENSSNNKLLAFAPEYKSGFNPDEYRYQFITRRNLKRDLFPIPGVIDEVNSIKSLLPSDVFIGSQATEGRFREIATDYDVLHLAMHAVIDNNHPLYSKLIFSLTDDTTEDGLLNVQEIFGLQLNARMVVLSACNTGEGDYSNGEGVMSLARGFKYAGTPSMIVTMWEVEDKSGGILMKTFYSNLLKGHSKSAALREAKLQYLKNARPENVHPFFWSSFIVMGNTQPLYNNNDYIWIKAGTGFLAMLIIIALFLFNKRNKQKRINKYV